MSSDAHQSVAQPQPDSVPIALEGLLERSPSAFPVVRLPILGRDAVVIGRRDRSADVVTEDGFVRTVYVGDQAEPVTDPVREAALLRRALRSVHAQAQESREHLSRAEAEHADTLARIRAYVIGKHRSGDICRTGLDEFLEEFALGEYDPRVRVSFTIVGTYEVSSDDVRAARNDADGYLRVDLDRLDNVVPDSDDVTVTVTSALVVDDDD